MVTSIDRLSRLNGTLLVTHAIYEGRRRIEFDVPVSYDFYIDGDVLRLRAKYNPPLVSVKSLPEEQIEDCHLLSLFWPKLDKILWNKTVDKLLGKEIRRNYATEGIFV